MYDIAKNFRIPILINKNFIFIYFLLSSLYDINYQNKPVSNKMLIAIVT